MKMEKRNSRIRTQVFESLKECIACAKKGEQTRITKHPNDYVYNRHYLMLAGLCEKCFRESDLSHLSSTDKSKIQCKNWGIKEDCLRYLHIKSVRVLAKLLGKPYVEKSLIRPKTLTQKGLCFSCYG